MLSKQALETIKRLQAARITELEDKQYNLTRKARYYYRNADIDEPTGEVWFGLLNAARDTLRGIKLELKALRATQKEVKLAIAYHVEWAKFVKQDSDPLLDMFKSTPSFPTLGDYLV